MQGQNTIKILSLSDFVVQKSWKVPVKLVGDDVKMTEGIGDLHAVVEDYERNMWFLLKESKYTTKRGNPDGMGIIGRLANPYSDKCSGKRWTFHRFGDLSPSGEKAIPFYIDICPNGRYVWFNSISSNEVGVVDAKEGDAGVPKIFTLPDHKFKSPTGLQEGKGVRPGGIASMDDGSALVTLYNEYGGFAHVSLEGDVKYVDVSETNDYAYLHVSAPKSLLAGEKGDLVLTAASNAFTSHDLGAEFDGIEHDLKSVDQPDMLRVLHNFDTTNMTWSDSVIYAPTQISMLHRTRQLFPETGDENYLIFGTTELRPVRLLVSYLMKP